MTSRATASQPDVERAAQQFLADGGNCLDAIVGGFFAAAAVDPGALFAPLAVLVAGVGRGVRSIDGRSLQPGAGKRRPRGLAPGQAITEAAFAAAPRSLSALALAHAYGANKPFAALVKPAAAAARKAGSDARAELLLAIASRGARALQHPEVQRRLLIAAGPSAGGMLAEEDLAVAPPGEERAFAVPRGSLTAHLPAWQQHSEKQARPGDDVRRQRMRPAEVLLAADATGSVAALGWIPDAEGVEIAELGVRLASDGAPVMRGVPRVRPQTPRPAALPLAVLSRPNEGWYAALGVTARGDLSPDEFGTSDEALSDLLARLADAQRGAVALAAVVARGKAQTSRVAGRR